MAEVDLITFFVGFFLNDLFGSYVLAVLFIIALILSFLLLSQTPKATWVIIPTIVIMGYATAGIYVPQWVAVLMWIAMGLVWGLILRRMLS